MASPLRASLGLCLGLAAFSLVAQTKPGIDPANMDLSVKPCEDFYAYANGGWLKSHALPADKARYGAMEELSERNRAILAKILTETSAKTTWAKGSIQQKVGDFYASGMDEATIEKRGLSPLKPVLATIEGLKDTKPCWPSSTTRVWAVASASPCSRTPRPPPSTWAPCARAAQACRIGTTT